MNKTFNLHGIGEIKMVKNTRAKRLTVAISPLSGVRVTVPGSMSFMNAEKFVLDKKYWIKKNLEKIQHIKNASTTFDSKIEYCTKEHKLRIIPFDKSIIKVIIKNKQIYVFYPSFADVKNEIIQGAIRKAIIEAWRIEAKKYLPARIKELAEKNGLKFNKINIKNAKTRWGSCSSANNINLNLQLMRLPQHLIDYIILHELAHTIHRNHGKAYWDFLNKLTGNARSLNKEMKKYNLNFW